MGRHSPMRKHTEKILVWILVCFCMRFNWCALDTAERLLLDHLMENHDRRIRPAANTSQPIQVSFGIEITQLIKILNHEQMLVLNVWVNQQWKNELMKWNSSEWGGVTHLFVEPTDVWIPDIMLYNNGDSGPAGGIDLYRTQILMYPDGTHFWLAPAVFTSTCKLNMKYFPFDDQHCQLKFGSWMHDSSQMNVTPGNRALITNTYTPS